MVLPFCAIPIPAVVPCFMEMEFQGVAFKANGAASEDLSITMGDGHGSRAWHGFMKLQVVRANILGFCRRGRAVIVTCSSTHTATERTRNVGTHFARGAFHQRIDFPVLIPCLVVSVPQRRTTAIRSSPNGNWRCPFPSIGTCNPTFPRDHRSHARQIQG